MGGNPSKKLEKQIQERYKYLRRCYDPFYGEIIVVKSLSTGKSYVRIDKTYQIQSNSLKKYISNRSDETLTPLYQLYAFRIDLCSEAQTFVLLFEYNNYTLREQILRRQKHVELFTFEEYLYLGYSMTHITLAFQKYSNL